MTLGDSVNKLQIIQRYQPKINPWDFKDMGSLQYTLQHDVTHSYLVNNKEIYLEFERKINSSWVVNDIIFFFSDLLTKSRQ